jgi:polyisoprenoid-binding protein YceI
LRSDDFLDANAFPQMRFTAVTARRTGERTYEVAGELELRGQSRPLTLIATWNKSEAYPFGGSPYVMGVSARGTLKRSAFGMSYAVDNGWVGDDVEIIVEFEARRR